MWGSSSGNSELFGRIPHQKKDEGDQVDVCMEPQNMGVVLNEYFLSVFNVGKDLDTFDVGEINSYVAQIDNITDEDVLEVLKHIKVHIPGT